MARIIDSGACTALVPKIIIVFECPFYQQAIGQQKERADKEIDEDNGNGEHVLFRVQYVAIANGEEDQATHEVLSCNTADVCEAGESYDSPVSA